MKKKEQKDNNNNKKKKNLNDVATRCVISRRPVVSGSKMFEANYQVPKL